MVIGNLRQTPFFAFLGERPTAQGWIGIAMIGAGAVLLVVKF